jgi:hypothetical protein
LYFSKGIQATTIDNTSKGLANHIEGETTIGPDNQVCSKKPCEFIAKLSVFISNIGIYV